MFCVCCFNSSLEIHTEGQFRSVKVFKKFSKSVHDLSDIRQVFYQLEKQTYRHWTKIEVRLKIDMNSMSQSRSIRLG